MSAPEKTVVVTGITGNLGLRLLREIPEFDVFGVDVPQRTDKSVVSSPLPSRFQSIDLGEEVSCRELIDLLRNTEAQAVVHLAFVDPQGTAGMDVNRTWRINVAGTARLMEAISVVNRNGGVIRKFLFISSASVY
ncbi:MAG TPA: NAD(P)-dependent oxidoreductase, partial [Terriglobales bacterium]|nr:NAD(P)-dependent oxidoreductase [Terriglobales bacterium]